MRLTENGTEVRWLPPSFSAQVPYVELLDDVVADTNRLSYDQATQRLTIAGKLSEEIYRKLLTCYASHPVLCQNSALLK